MRKETRSILSEKIRQYKKNKGITYKDECPFPASWKTIWSILSGSKEQNFRAKTQKKLLDFFGIEYDQEGNDLVIKQEKQMIKKPEIIFGIDPAFRENGFAMASLNLINKNIDFKIFKDGFLSFSSWFVNEIPQDMDVLFSVENSNLQITTFDMTGNSRVIAAKSRSVGKNQAISQCVVDLCLSKYNVLDLSPRQKGKKWSALTFERQLKQNKILRLDNSALSQDEIDGGQLAIIGMNRFYEAKQTII